MALVIKDRVKQTSTTSGTGVITLAGTVTGFQTFAIIGNGNSTYYCIADQNGPNWEVGIGIYISGTLSRDTILANSDGTTTPVTFTSTIKDVFCTYPSEKAMLGDISALTSTGTGNIVLSNSPTLSGNISANVNLRSDTLNNLLPLAGGTSEIGYATDVDMLVRFNGTAGQAQVLGAYGNGGTLNFEINEASYAANTAANPIDCRYISCLNLSFDPLMVTTVANLFIKLPISALIPTLDVNYGNEANFVVYSQGYNAITVSYQAEDIALGSNTYKALANDPQITNVVGFYTGSGTDLPYAVTIRFRQAAATTHGWTRLPLPSEGTYLKNPITGYVGQVVNGQSISTALTSGTIANVGYLVLQPGTWLVYSTITWTLGVGTVASELIYSGSNLVATTISTSEALVRTEINGSLGTVLSYAASPFQYPTSSTSQRVAASVTINNTSGEFSCNPLISAAYTALVRIQGTLTGTGSITGYTGTPKLYRMSTVTGNIGAATGFTLTELDGTALVTTAGTVTGLTIIVISQIIFGNTRATFSVGSVTGSVILKAVRIA